MDVRGQMRRQRALARTALARSEDHNVHAISPKAARSSILPFVGPKFAALGAHELMRT
jgi:hypothetical protein